MKMKQILLFPCHHKRFWNKVDKNSEGCWEWKGALNRSGYGVFANYNRHFLAHRVSYYITHGPIDDGLLVLHKCDNKKCVNPDHLYTGYQVENMRDRIERNPNNRGGQVSRLSKQDADKIKKLYLTNSLDIIASMYNMSRMAIYHIVKGITTNFKS